MFIQSGGTNTGTGLRVGNQGGSSGTYNLSNGLFRATYEYVGQSGTGVVNQTGGNNTVTDTPGHGSLVLGGFPGSSGTYNLSNGLLSVDESIVGNYGAGVMNQWGGTNKVTYDLHLGDLTGGSGTYNLSNGLLSANNTYVGYSGTGVVNQAGGNHTVTNILWLGHQSGSSGIYNLSNGVLSAANTFVGGAGTGVVNQVGGSLQ